MIIYTALGPDAIFNDRLGVFTTSHRFYDQALAEVKNGDAEIMPYTAPVTTTADKISAIRDAIGLHIETVAKSAGDFGFDSVLSAVSYRDGESNDINSIYSTAVFKYRNACYVKTRKILKAWQVEGAEITPKEAVAAMPLWADYKPAE
tara:strand:- start:1373 stop:1816 length:444 start_codon:yes stop_codon:yes gene_type:complete